MIGEDRVCDFENAVNELEIIREDLNQICETLDDLISSSKIVMPGERGAPARAKDTRIKSKDFGNKLKCFRPKITEILKSLVDFRKKSVILFKK